MTIDTLKKKLGYYGFFVKPSAHRTLIIYTHRPVKNIKGMSYEAHCAEVSTSIAGQYYILKSEILSDPVIDIINHFASTKLPARKNVSYHDMFILASKSHGAYKIWSFFHNKRAVDIDVSLQDALNRPSFYLTRKQMASLENYLLSRHVNGLIVKSVRVKG